MKKINKFLKRLLQEQRRQKKSEKLSKSLLKTPPNNFSTKAVVGAPGTLNIPEKDPIKGDDVLQQVPLSPFDIYWIQDGECMNHSIPSVYICGEPGADAFAGSFLLNPSLGLNSPSGQFFCADPNVLPACSQNTFECFTSWAINNTSNQLTALVGGMTTANQSTYTGLSNNCYGCTYTNDPTPTSGDNLNIADTNDGSCVFEGCYVDQAYNEGSEFHFCIMYPTLCNNSSTINPNIGTVTNTGCDIEGCTDPFYVNYNQKFFFHQYLLYH